MNSSDYNYKSKYNILDTALLLYASGKIKTKNKIDSTINLFEKAFLQNTISEEDIEYFTNLVSSDIEYTFKDVESRNKFYNKIAESFYFLIFTRMIDNNNLLYPKFFSNALKIITKFSKDHSSLMLTNIFLNDISMINNLDDIKINDYLFFIDSLQTKSIYTNFSFSIFDRIQNMGGHIKDISIGIDKNEDSISYLGKTYIDCVVNRLSIYFKLFINEITDKNIIKGIHEEYIYSMRFSEPLRNIGLLSTDISSNNVYNCIRRQMNRHIPNDCPYDSFGLMIIFELNIDPTEYLTKSFRLWFGGSSWPDTISKQFGYLFPFELCLYMEELFGEYQEIKYNDIKDYIEYKFSDYFEEYNINIDQVVDEYNKRLTRLNVYNSRKNLVQSYREKYKKMD